MTLPDRPEHEFGIFARDERGISPYPYAFRLSELSNLIETEPNNDAPNATAFTAPLALNGVIEKASDVDLFAFKARKGERYDVRVFARALRSPLDSVLTIGVKGGGNLASNDDAAGSPDSALRFDAPNDGEYVISIRDQLFKGGPDYVYRIEVGPITPDLVLSVPTESRYQNRAPTSALAVPRGNRQAILVNASRLDLGGELSIRAEDLPAGLRMEADPMAASVSALPVLFHAEPGAPVAGSLARFRGALSDTSSPIKFRSHFRQTVELVLGQNNNPFWVRTEDRFAAAVTAEAPYTIDAIEPRVPIVRGGLLDLKVVAHRQPGFKAPIGVALLWNPPGIGSSASVQIPEGKDEVTIPINVNDGAELRSWRTVVQATAEGSNGPISVASGLTRLTVAEKFVAFEFQAATVEQGKSTDLVVKVNKLSEFDGEAEVTLLGLPNKVTTEPRKLGATRPSWSFL